MTRYIFILALVAAPLAASAGEEMTFDVLDANSDGFVSESEFVSWKTSLGDASPAEALVTFLEIDADANGMISEAELTAAKATMPADDSSHSDDSM